MLKYVLLASSIMVSAPVLAQDKPADALAAPATQASPAQTMPTTPPTATDPAANPSPRAATPIDDAMKTMTAQTDPAKPADPAAPQDAQTAQATPASPATQTAAQPASGPAQVAQVVNSEFPAYDKDANGTLSQAEFASWMVALKTKSDPSTKADSPATKAWVSQAFASADKDKNKSLSKDELTGFLAQSG